MIRKTIQLKIQKLEMQGKEVKHRRIIMRVFEVKHTGQLMVTIPKSSGILKGEFVEIKKIE